MAGSRPGWRRGWCPGQNATSQRERMKTCNGAEAMRKNRKEQHQRTLSRWNSEDAMPDKCENVFSVALGNLQLWKLREQTEQGLTFMKSVCHYLQSKSPEHLVPQQENKGFRGSKNYMGWTQEVWFFFRRTLKFYFFFWRSITSWYMKLLSVKRLNIVSGHGGSLSGWKIPLTATNLIYEYPP